MILQQFPDINMVRRLNNKPSDTNEQWRNVVLNFNCKHAFRTGVESPYSLFINNTGFSYCTVNKRQYRIEDNTYLIAKPGDIYDLTIDNSNNTELCNIHINKDFFEASYNALACSSNHLLDQSTVGNSSLPEFVTQLHIKDKRFQSLTRKLTDPGDIDSFEVKLVHIIEHLLLSNKEVINQIESLPFMKPSVRTDIYRRLSLAKDIIISNYEANLDLDTICREIGMSKFHFLRVFKGHFGVTPYQYLTQVRMRKAGHMLVQNRLSINEIADNLGFEFPNSFNKAFQKTYGMSPQQYRQGQIG